MPNFMIEILAYMIMAFFASIPFIIIYCAIRVIVTGNSLNICAHSIGKRNAIKHVRHKVKPALESLSMSTRYAGLPGNAFNRDRRLGR